eukprot:4477998-Prymnesium_polylepis.1
MCAPAKAPPAVHSQRNSSASAMQPQLLQRAVATQPWPRCMAARGAAICVLRIFCGRTFLPCPQIKIALSTNQNDQTTQLSRVYARRARRTHPSDRVGA